MPKAPNMIRCGKSKPPAVDSRVDRLLDPARLARRRFVSGLIFCEPQDIPCTGNGFDLDARRAGLVKCFTQDGDDAVEALIAHRGTAPARFEQFGA